MTDHRFYHIRAALDKPSECTGCVLEHLGAGFSQPEGTGVSRLMVIGEALGENECKDGLPFRPHAQAGSVLERAFKRIGSSREAHVLWNCVACQPPRNELSGASYEMQALQHCRVHLNRVIEQYRPKAILALGGVALRSLTGMAGHKQSIEHLRGFALSSPEFPDIPIIASYHPSYIVRGAWNVFPVLCRDLKYAISVARDGFKPVETDYIETAQPRDLDWIIEQCSTGEPPVLSVDFETEGNPNVFEDRMLMLALEDLYGEKTANKKTKKQRERLGTNQKITQVNLSIKEGQSFVFQWSNEIAERTNRLLQLPCPKIGHNVYSFDMPVAQYNGLDWNFDNGVTDDTMLMFHHLSPDVPGRRGKMDGDLDGSFANLQYCASFYGFDFPWKHFVQERPEFYGCADSDAALRLYNGLVHDMRKLKHPETGISVWDSYTRLVADLWPILRSASVRGMPVNRHKLLAFLDSVVKRQRTLGAKIQAIIPATLLPTKQKSGLKRIPKNIEDYALRTFDLLAEDNRCKCFRVRKKDVEYWTQTPNAVVGPDGKLRAPDSECEVCRGTGYTHLPARTEERWCKLEAFNPNSPVQMKLYARHHHHKIPKNKDKKYAMDKWTLDQLYRSTRDPLYKSTSEYRQFEKMSAYVIGWTPHADDRAHPEFSTYPATGQISSFNPNAQNMPSLSKYGPLAEELRDGVEAPPNHKIIELDMRSFHAQTLGYEANCPEYVRLAKLDVHSFVAGNMLNLPHFKECLEWDDNELLQFLKWHRKNYTCPDGTPFQKVRDERAKVGVLAFGLGQMASSLFTSNRDSFLPDWYVAKRDKGEKLIDKEHTLADRQGLVEAQKVHDALNERFPKLKNYRDDTPMNIKRSGGKAVSRYGCVRWFWDIMHWDSKRGEMVHGSDWEKAISFYVQNDGHGYLKYALLDAQETYRERGPYDAVVAGYDKDYVGLLDRYGFINTVHDSIVFCCHDRLVEECIHDMKEKLEKPSTVLTWADGTGLSVECESKIGSTWGQMKEV